MKHKNLRVCLVLIVALVGTAALLFLLSGPTPVHAGSPRYVAPDCTGAPAPCYTTLQAAVDAADPGDEIRVAAGHYTGVQTIGGARQLVYISKTITLCGGYTAPDFADPPDPENNPTVLDAEGQGRVIHIVFESPTVEGFWITGGNASHALFDAGRGGGIYSNGGAPIIANNVISGNIAYTSTNSSGYGGGIYVWDVWSSGSVVISGNQVISNVASTSYSGSGGGIRIGDANGVQVLSNVVLSNTGTVTGGYGYGGGIHLVYSQGAIAHGNQIEYNVAQRVWGFSGSYGGGIYCELSDDVVLSDNVIRHNTASLPRSGGGGGIHIARSKRARVEGNTLKDNRGSETGFGLGGGLLAIGSHDLLLSANWVLSNSANRGGGIHMYHDTSFTMTNNIVAANAASSQGGGLAFDTDVGEPVTGTLLHNTFAANNQGSGEGRSAIHTFEPYVSLALTNNLIYSHTYGVIVVPTSSVRLYNTLFYANDSDTSGSGAISNTDPITGQNPLLDRDYHLLAGSPAIDAGVDAGVSSDVDGEMRPMGLGYDVGADEFYERAYEIYLPVVLR